MRSIFPSFLSSCSLVLGLSGWVQAQPVTPPVDPPPIPKVVDLVAAKAKIGGVDGWRFSFSIEGDNGISSFHVRSFGGGWIEGQVSGRSLVLGDPNKPENWNFYKNINLLGDTPPTVGWQLKGGDPDANLTGSFEFFVTAPANRLPGDAAAFDYRFDSVWSVDLGNGKRDIYRTEYTFPVPTDLLTEKVVTYGPIPEPSSVLLLALGLGVMGWRIKGSRRVTGVRADGV